MVQLFFSFWYGDRLLRRSSLIEPAVRLLLRFLRYNVACSDNKRSKRHMGVLSGIARRDSKRAPMQTLHQAEISAETGVALDWRGKPGKRQVTVISAESWRDACAELEKEVAWTTRRANLLVEGIDLPETAGAVLCIGAVRLLVTGEVDPCSRMDEQCPGLTAALQPEWRGGVSCAVLAGGTVAVGDSVALQPAASG